MEFRALSGTASEELERLGESGALAGGVALERTGQVGEPVLVRPVVGDALAGWMPELERLLDVVKGVIGICGTDMSEAAGLAAHAAAWLGDRGRTVVLVDATVENPVLGKALDEDRDEGLVDAVLFGVSRAAVVRRTLAPGVSVVTAGSHPLSVDEVFEADAFSKILRALAEDALVLALVPPVHVTKTLSALDAVVCVAGTGADVASLASCTGDVRTMGILVVEPGEAAHVEEPGEAAHVEEPGEAAHVEEPGEAAERPPLVLPTRDDSAGFKKWEAAAREATTGRPERGRQETEPRRDDSGGAERTPVVLGASLPRRRMAPSHLAAGAALLVVVAIATLLWWFVDGERRLNSWLDDSSWREHERVVEGRDSEPVEDSPARPGDMDEAGTTELTTDREGTAAGGEDASGGETTSEGEREAPGEEIASARLDESDVHAVRESPDGGTVITGPGGRYRIMVSSHRHEGAAVFEAGQLIEGGVGAEVVATEVKDRGTWFRVVVSGGYPMLSAAREDLDTVKSLGYEGAWIERAADNE